MVFRVLGLRFAGSLLPVLLKQCRPEFREQGFDLPSVTQGALKERNEFFRKIHAAALAALGEGKNVSRVFVAAGASSATWSEARFADLSDGALNGRPELGQLLEEKVSWIGIGREEAAHMYGICKCILTRNKKMMSAELVIPLKTEGLQFQVLASWRRLPPRI